MNRNFYWIIVTRFLFVLGVESQAVLMGWQMFDLTHDPLKLGLMGLSEALPAIAFSLPAGLLIDRFNPFRFYQTTLLVSFCSMMISWHAKTPNALFLAGIITGCARAFTGPSMNAFIPRIVPREEYKRASAYTATAFKSATVVGPGMAGVLLGLSGYTYPYIIAVGALVAGSLSLLMVRYVHNHKRDSDIHFGNPSSSKANLSHELLLGVRYVFHHPLLLSAMSLDMFAVLFGGVTAILPFFAADILHVGPQGLGWLRAAPAFGAIWMGLYLIKRPIAKRAGVKFLASVFGFGICILLFAISKNFWLSLAVLAVSGALDSVSMVVRGSIVQLCSPEEMRGRISAVNAVFIGSSNEIGEFESGLAAKLFGTVPSVIFGGMMTLITVTFVYFKVKTLRDLDFDKIG